MKKLPSVQSVKDKSCESKAVKFDKKLRVGT